MEMPKVVTTIVLDYVVLGCTGFKRRIPANMSYHADAKFIAETVIPESTRALRFYCLKPHIESDS